MATAKQQWQKLSASAEQFVAALEQLAPQHGLTSATVDAPEAWLFAAWLQNPTTAIAEFTTCHRNLVLGIAAKHGLSESDGHDILSQVVTRLFVGDAEQPGKFATYVGRGQLGGLMRVAATRMALTIVAGHDRNSQEVPATLASDGRDIAGKYAKAQLQSLLKQALEESAGLLTERQRSLLRMHYVKQASIDDIGVVYRVHRATAARWLSDAKQTMIDSAREKFMLRAALEAHELDEVASMVESQLSMTWSRLFVET
jgi:RNA polymerase sigma-70 factor, ECF subfamily